MRRFVSLAFLIAASCSASFAQEQNGPKLFHQPTANPTHIAFSYAGDIWTVERGGGIQLPNLAAYNPNTGRWDIENHGITPDIDVEILPKDWLAGRDPQLEKAVEVAMRELAKTKPAPRLRPKYPVHK